jgi:hypothetical protein
VVTHLLLLFLAADDAGGPASAALVRALAEVLGAGVHVEVRRYEGAPADDLLAEAGRSAHAEAIARLAWDDARHARAQVHVRLLATDQVHDQILTFEPSDPEAERGRALGFVIASHLLPGLARPPPSVPAPLEVTAPAPAPPSPLSPPRPARWALEALAAGGIPVDGAGSSIGAGIAARFLSSGGSSVRLGGHVRAGEISVAQASFLSVALSAGGAYVVAGGRTSSSPTLALRAEMMALYEALTHFSSDDPAPVRRGRWLPGAAGLLELTLPLAPGVGVQLAAGAEAAFGATVVFLHDDEVAALSVARAVAEVGFQARF